MLTVVSCLLKEIKRWHTDADVDNWYGKAQIDRELYPHLKSLKLYCCKSFLVGGVSHLITERPHKERERQKDAGKPYNCSTSARVSKCCKALCSSQSKVLYFIFVCRFLFSFRAVLFITCKHFWSLDSSCAFSRKSYWQLS